MGDQESLLPTYTRKNHEYWVRLKFGHFAIFTVGLPFCAFVFCVYHSTVYNFRESTATHCQVDNYLPSVSAAIGSFTPQIYVWMGAIVIHFLPRLSVANQYFLYLKSTIVSQSFRLIKITWLLNVIEVTCLLGLTLVSSTLFYPAHAFFFMTFVISSILYMIVSCHLLKNRRFLPPGPAEARSLRLKQYLLAVNLTGFLFAGFCFVRHNYRCEPGMYSWFAFFEYVVVLSNMAFHMTACLDFRDRLVSLSCCRITFS